jgi:hypothetical protein
MKVLTYGTDLGVLLTVVVSGGNMKNPGWSDKQGNMIGVEDTVEEYEVMVSPESTETSPKISPEQETKIRIKVFTVTVEMYSLMLSLGTSIVL